MHQTSGLEDRGFKWIDSKVNSADYTVNSPVKMPPKERKNRYKIQCLECNVEMDFDYKKKHNLKFHQDLLKQRKSIRYNVVGAPDDGKSHI